MPEVVGQGGTGVGKIAQARGVSWGDISLEAKLVCDKTKLEKEGLGLREAKGQHGE